MVNCDSANPDGCQPVSIFEVAFHMSDNLLKVGESAAQVQNVTRVIMFTDLVGSSGLKIKWGDERYAREIALPHNKIFRRLLKVTPGALELNYTGDGFFASFQTVQDAVNVALLFHHAMRRYPWQAETPLTRVGIHTGQMVVIDGGEGQVEQISHAADMCARLMSLGCGGQTLLTRHAFDDGRQYVREHPALPAGLFAGIASDVSTQTAESEAASSRTDVPAIEWLAHGQYIMKGKDDDPLEVFEVGAVGLAPLKAPPDSEKVRRAVRADEEELLGWRPALDREVPGKAGWLVDRKLGEGGFGEVWLVRNVKTKQQRVFKFCFDLDRVRSFKRELTLFRLIREALGEREDIATLLDVRLDKPPYFLEGEFVESGDLSQWATKQGGLAAIPPATRLGIVAKVARAVAAAHSLGIIHKDIKPNNVFIKSKTDGTVQPLLADFGIGAIADKSLLAQHNITFAGFTQTLMEGNHSSRTGTRLYAPPESQVGKLATTAGDIYALGVMAYQLAIADFERPLAQGWERDVNDELLREDISLCVMGDPAQRIGSATELATRIETLEQRRAELAASRKAEARRIEVQRRAQEEREQAQRNAAEQARRNRILRISLAVAAVVAVIVGGLAVFSYLQMIEANAARAKESVAKNDAVAAQQREETAKNDALAAKLRAESEADRARRSDYANRIAWAEAEIQRANIARARTLLDACPADLRHYEWHRLRSVMDVSVATLRGHEGPVFSIALSADGKRIVSASGDGTIKVWDAEQVGEALLTMTGHGEAVHAIAFSIDGKRIVSAGEDRTIKVWDAANGGAALLTLRGHEEAIASVALSGDGKRIVSGSWDGTIKVWDAEKGGEALLTLHGHEGVANAVRSVAISADGKRIVSASDDETIKVWDAEKEGEALLTLRGHEQGVRTIALSADGKWIVSGGVDKTIKLWDAEKGGEALVTLRGHESVVTSIALTTDGKRIVSASGDNMIKVWDAEKGGQALLTLRGHEDSVRSIAISADGKRIVSASVDKSIKLWDTEKGSEAMLTLRGLEQHVHSVALSADGKRIVSGSWDKTIKVWDAVKGGEALLTLRGLQESSHAIAFSADGRRIVSDGGKPGKPGEIMVWDAVNGGEALLTLRGHDEAVTCVALSADGKRIASGSGDWLLEKPGDIKVWDAKNGGAALLTLRGHGGPVHCIALSADGKRIVSGSHDRTIKVWDAVKGGEALHTLRGHQEAVTSVALSADGKRIVSASWESGKPGEIKVWDAENGSEAMLTLRGHEAAVTSVAFSFEGKRIVSGSDDKTIKVWDAENGGEALLTLRGHSDAVTSVSLSTDTARLVSGSTGGTIKVWNAK